LEEVAAVDADRNFAEGLWRNLFRRAAHHSVISRPRPCSPILLAACLATVLLFAAPLFGGNAPDLLPDTSIAPVDTGSPPTTPSPPRHTTTPPAPAPSNEAGSEAAAPPAPIVHHHPVPRPNATPIPNLVFEVEPAEARVLLHNDTTAYLQPSKMSPIIQQLQAGKFIHVTGTTHYFLQAKLKNGSVAYVPADDAYLTVPADKIFRLTSDTPVLERPNKWAKQLAMVHQGHDVHVVGVALSYMKIQMKSGLEGYITTRALE
jgi:hypothetical protein